jgi:hypothetical protein
MGIVPVQELPTPSSLLTTTPTAYRMGADPNMMTSRRRLQGKRESRKYTNELMHASRNASLNASLSPAVPPTHWVMNAVGGIDGPGAWATARNGADSYVLYWPSYLVDGKVAPPESVWIPTLAELVRVEGEGSNATHTATLSTAHTTAHTAAPLTAKDASDKPVDKPVHHIRFEGLSFTGGDRYCWGGADSGGIQHDYAAADAPDALLRLRIATDIDVVNCRFERSGGAGVRMDLLAMRNVIQGCEFARLGLQGVVVVGYGAGKKDASRENTVANCEIHHTGREKFDAPAIVLWHTAFNNITANHIHHTPSKGVCVSGSPVCVN